MALLSAGQKIVILMRGVVAFSINVAFSSSSFPLTVSEIELHMELLLTADC